VKNKVAPPFQEAEFDIIYNKGINRPGEIIDLGLQLGLLEKSGSFIKYAGESIGQGRNQAMAWVTEHPTESAQLVDAILSAPRGSKTETAAQAEAA
jgi:recombination protein RecA